MLTLCCCLLQFWAQGLCIQVRTGILRLIHSKERHEVIIWVYEESMGPCWAHSSTVLDSSYQYYLFHLQPVRVILNERTAHFCWLASLWSSYLETNSDLLHIYRTLAATRRKHIIQSGKRRYLPVHRALRAFKFRIVKNHISALRIIGSEAYKCILVGTNLIVRLLHWNQNFVFWND